MFVPPRGRGKSGGSVGASKPVGGKITGPLGETKLPTSQEPVKTLSEPKKWITNAPEAVANLRAQQRAKLSEAIAEKVAAEAPKPAPVVETAKPGLATPHENRLSSYVEQADIPNEGVGIRVKSTIHGQTVPKDYVRNAHQELRDITTVVKENLNSRHRATEIDGKAAAAYEKAEAALSLHMRGIDDVIPSLNWADDDQPYLVQSSQIPPAVKQLKYEPNSSRAKAQEENAQAFVDAVMKGSDKGAALTVNDGQLAKSPTLNAHPSMFVFDEQNKVLQWNHAFVPSAPSGLKAPAAPPGSASIDFNLNVKR
jgi:hypothetical protein